MKFAAFFLALFACLSFTLSAPLDAQSRGLASIDELNEFFSQVIKRDVNDMDISKRDDIPILTTLFTALNKSGLVPPVVKLLDTNKVTEPLLVDGIAFFLKLVKLEDLLSAVDSSNLGVDLVVRALTYPDFFPGLYQVVQDLRVGSTPAVPKSTLNVFQLSSAVAPILSTVNQVQGSGQALNSALNDLGVQTNSGSGIIGGILAPVAAANEAEGTAAATKVLPATLAQGSSIPTGAKAGSGSGSGSSGSTTSSSPKAATTTAAGASKTSAAASTSSSAAPSSSSSSGSKGGLSGLIGSIGKFFGFKRELPIEQIVERDNKLLDQLVGSLEKSGLAMSVVYNLIVDKDQHPFLEDLIKKIVKNKLITLDQLQSALENTDLINHIVINLLKQNALGINI